MASLKSLFDNFSIWFTSVSASSLIYRDFLVFGNFGHYETLGSIEFLLAGICLWRCSAKARWLSVFNFPLVPPTLPWQKRGADRNASLQMAGVGFQLSPRPAYSFLVSSPVWFSSSLNSVLFSIPVVKVFNVCIIAKAFLPLLRPEPFCSWCSSSRPHLSDSSRKFKCCV